MDSSGAGRALKNSLVGAREPRPLPTKSLNNWMQITPGDSIEPWVIQLPSAKSSSWRGLTTEPSANNLPCKERVGPSLLTGVLDSTAWHPQQTFKCEMLVRLSVTHRKHLVLRVWISGVDEMIWGKGVLGLFGVKDSFESWWKFFIFTNLNINLHEISGTCLCLGSS